MGFGRSSGNEGRYRRIFGDSCSRRRKCPHPLKWKLLSVFLMIATLEVHKYERIENAAVVIRPSQAALNTHLASSAPLGKPKLSPVQSTERSMSRPSSPSSSEEDALLTPGSPTSSALSDHGHPPKKEVRFGDRTAFSTLLIGLALFVGATWWVILVENWSKLGSLKWFSGHPTSQSAGIALVVLGSSNRPLLSPWISC